MSMVGYTMGIGDRHPSNILIMRKTCRAVHIDFNDSFEKASLRDYVREIVPFRLTRMIVSALGPSGTHGVFRYTATEVMDLMRRNKGTLLAFLDIFLKEPVTDAKWYQNASASMGYGSSHNQDNALPFEYAIKRVRAKLNGTEFVSETLDVQSQVDKLIEMATSEAKLAQMYFGWAPYW